MRRYIFLGLVLAVIVGGMWLVRGDERASIDSLSEHRETPKIAHVHGLGVDIADPTKLYLATHHGLLLLRSGTELSLVGSSTNDLMGFSIHPSEPGTFFSSGHARLGNNLGLQISRDAGVSWQMVSPGIGGPVDFHALAVSWVDPNLIYGYYHGSLHRSTDGGQVWELLSVPFEPFALTTHAGERSIVFAATREGLYQSTDMGVTWELVSPQLGEGMVTAVAMSPANDGAMLVFAETIGGLGKSIDAGKTWQKLPEDFEGQTVLYFAYSKSSPQTVYAVTHRNSVYRSETGGEAWQKIR